MLIAIKCSFFCRYYTAARDEQQLLIAIEDQEVSVVDEITKKSQGMFMEELQRFKKGLLSVFHSQMECKAVCSCHIFFQLA